MAKLKRCKPSPQMLSVMRKLGHAGEIKHYMLGECSVIFSGNEAIRSVGHWVGGLYRHILISHPQRLPSSEEIKTVRSALLDSREPAIQIHPAKGAKVHEHGFHIWQLAKKGNGDAADSDEQAKDPVLPEPASQEGGNYSPG